MTVTIRPATAADVDRIAQLIHNVPTAETAALVGDLGRARAFGIGLVELDRIPNPDKPTVVAERDGAIVGVVQYTVDRPGSPITLEHVRLVFRIAGPWRFVRGIRRAMARVRVDLPVPPGTFYIAEIHVDPEQRGQGIGGQLLDWVDQEAARLGREHLSLVTYAGNPARRLYERHGYVVTAEKNHPSYERYTGNPGRILMEKRLGA